MAINTPRIPSVVDSGYIGFGDEPIRTVKNSFFGRIWVWIKCGEWVSVDDFKLHVQRAALKYVVSHSKDKPSEHDQELQHKAIELLDHADGPMIGQLFKMAKGSSAVRDHLTEELAVLEDLVELRDELKKDVKEGDNFAKLSKLSKEIDELDISLKELTDPTAKKLHDGLLEGVQEAVEAHWSALESSGANTQAKFEFADWAKDCPQLTPEEQTTMRTRMEALMAPLAVERAAADVREVTVAAVESAAGSVQEATDVVAATGQEVVDAVVANVINPVGGALAAAGALFSDWLGVAQPTAEQTMAPKIATVTAKLQGQQKATKEELDGVAREIDAILTELNGLPPDTAGRLRQTLRVQIGSFLAAQWTKFYRGADAPEQEMLKQWAFRWDETALGNLSPVSLRRKAAHPAPPAREAPGIPVAEATRPEPPARPATPPNIREVRAAAAKELAEIATELSEIEKMAKELDFASAVQTYESLLDWAAAPDPDRKAEVWQERVNKAWDRIGRIEGDNAKRDALAKRLSDTTANVASSGWRALSTATNLLPIDVVHFSEWAVGLKSLPEGYGKLFTEAAQKIQEPAAKRPAYAAEQPLDLGQLLARHKMPVGDVVPSGKLSRSMKERTAALMQSLENATDWKSLEGPLRKTEELIKRLENHGGSDAEKRIDRLRRSVLSKIEILMEKPPTLQAIKDVNSLVAFAEEHPSVIAVELELLKQMKADLQAGAVSRAELALANIRDSDDLEKCRELGELAELMRMPASGIQVEHEEACNRVRTLVSAMLTQGLGEETTEDTLYARRSFARKSPELVTTEAKQTLQQTIAAFMEPLIAENEEWYLDVMAQQGAIREALRGSHNLADPDFREKLATFRDLVQAAPEISSLALSFLPHEDLKSTNYGVAQELAGASGFDIEAEKVRARRDKASFALTAWDIERGPDWQKLQELAAKRAALFTALNDPLIETVDDFELQIESAQLHLEVVQSDANRRLDQLKAQHADFQAIFASTDKAINPEWALADLQFAAAENPSDEALKTQIRDVEREIAEKQREMKNVEEAIANFADRKTQKVKKSLDNLIKTRDAVVAIDKEVAPLREVLTARVDALLSRVTSWVDATVEADLREYALGSSTKAALDRFIRGGSVEEVVMHYEQTLYKQLQDSHYHLDELADIKQHISSAVRRKFAGVQVRT